MILKKALLLCASFIFTHTLYANEDRVKLVGDIFYALIPLGSYTSTFYMDDDEGRMEFYKSFAMTAGLTYGLKYTVDAPRPDGSDNHSFPSGHSSITFQSAVFLHKRYGLKYALLSYAGATFVGFSRVYANEHYSRDVIAGTVIGGLSAWFFTDKDENIKISFKTEERKRVVLLKYEW